jgi:hypothetical protein
MSDGSDPNGSAYFTASLCLLPATLRAILGISMIHFDYSDVALSYPY